MANLLMETLAWVEREMRSSLRLSSSYARLSGLVVVEVRIPSAYLLQIKQIRAISQDGWTRRHASFHVGMSNETADTI